MISRRERFEILKITQGLSERVVAVDDGQAKSMRPNAILRALEKDVARRHREGRFWASLDQLRTWCRINREAFRR